MALAWDLLEGNIYTTAKKKNLIYSYSFRFATQLLNSLVLLQKHKLIHCDLKPEVIDPYTLSSY